MDKNQQWKIVLAHLQSGQSITSLEAIEKYGFTRLSAIIFILKRMGYKIAKEIIKVPTRYGTETRVARYTLITED